MTRLFIFTAMISLWCGCTLIDSDQPNPAYLNIDSVSVALKSDQGEPTHKLSDVWVYADNQLLGVFEVPARIPIIPNAETTELRISPGFRNNGERSRSFIYNLMQSVDRAVALQPGDQITINPVFSYQEDIIFDFIESFEGGGNLLTLDLDENLQTNVVNTSEDKRSGSKSGKIALTTENSEIRVGTVFEYDRANNAGVDTYLEMDYKNDVPFFVGCIYVQDGQEVTQPMLVLNPSDEWNKIYVDFTSILSSPAIETYRVFFTTDIEPVGVDQGTIYLDNLKFIHL